MSFHLDREEFDEWVAEGAFDRIWSAYEYAVNGAEQSVVKNLQDEIERLRNRAKELEVYANQYDEAVKALEKIGWPCRLQDLPQLYVEVCKHLKPQSIEELKEEFIDWRFTVDRDCALDVFDLAMGWFASKGLSHDNVLEVAVYMRDKAVYMRDKQDWSKED